jgi:protein-S-isoprenylcysteine O-methyltransferase Ste14
VSVAFDSGGVTTGPITVPYIMAMGLGLASVRGDRESMEDSFGLVALCSIGPIIAVLILGICYHPEGMSYTAPIIPEVATSRDAVLEFVRNLPHEFIEVAAAVWPILAVLFIFQLLTKRYRRLQLWRIVIGFIYTFIGLVLFLTGVNVGFIPVGQSLGSDIGASSVKWLLIPLGALIGYFVVAAEPAVHVLKKQVEEVSGGAIPGQAVQRYLSIGVSCSLAISMLRVLTGISIYYILIPGYAIAIALTFFTPKIFTGIAFDSGGVVSGPMTSTFLLPFAIGACIDPDRIMTDAFGLVAMVAMTPLITIQLMGLTYKSKMQSTRDIVDIYEEAEDEIVEFGEDAWVPEDDAMEYKESFSNGD